MPMTNTAAAYGGIAKTFHWIIAVGIIVMIPMGIIANGLPFDTPEQLAQKAWLFSLHKTIGVTLFFVALARIGWALSQPKPAALHPDRKVETLLAEVVHWLLYGSLVLVPLLGWVHHAATEGFAPIWWPFGQNLPLVPENEHVAEIAAGLHIVFERVLAFSVVLHIAGAVKHAVIDKDGTLARMLPGGTPSEAPNTPHKQGVMPAVLAVLVWAAALGVGNVLGVYGTGATTTPAAPTLEAAGGDWAVEDGTLSITIQQLGSGVTGSFAEWTADITFDETVSDGTVGAVTVNIAIPSLALGSVTSQAMESNFFDAETFPVARYTADLIAAADGSYLAQGTLDLRGATVDVTLPFELSIEGNTATMSGATTLDRRQFGIGGNMTDGNQLGFEVRVSVALTATRG